MRQYNSRFLPSMIHWIVVLLIVGSTQLLPIIVWSFQLNYRLSIKTSVSTTSPPPSQPSSRFSVKVEAGGDFASFSHQQESDRLIKARQLLSETVNGMMKEEEQDIDCDDDDDDGFSPSNWSLNRTKAVFESFWSSSHAFSNYTTSKNSSRWADGVHVAEPRIPYDPVATEQQLSRKPIKCLLRNLQIAAPLGWWGANVLVDCVQGNLAAKRRVRAKQLTHTLTALGPAIVKVGQMLASRPDLLPLEYLEELQTLQYDVPWFSNEEAWAIVEKELKLNSFTDVFELVQEDPVAAASIGQVYQARLKTTGELVALKVQRPDCEELIRLDLFVLRWWSGICSEIFGLFGRDVDLQSVIDDFGQLTYRELDYLAEMANTQRFDELYTGAKDICVPKVHPELTTEKVLVMEWVDGVRLTDKEGLQRYQLDEADLVDTLVQCSLQQILGRFCPCCSTDLVSASHPPDRLMHCYHRGWIFPC